MFYDGGMIEDYSEPKSDERVNVVLGERVSASLPDVVTDNTIKIPRSEDISERLKNKFKHAKEVRENNPIWPGVDTLPDLMWSIAQEGKFVELLEMIPESRNILKEYGENDQSIREIIQEAIRSLIHQVETSATRIPDSNSAIGRFLEKVNLSPDKNQQWAKDSLIYLEQMLSLVQNSQNESLNTLVERLQKAMSK